MWSGLGPFRLNSPDFPVHQTRELNPPENLQLLARKKKGKNETLQYRNKASLRAEDLCYDINSNNPAVTIFCCIFYRLKCIFYSLLSTNNNIHVV
jgi:hypothetical protein